MREDSFTLKLTMPLEYIKLEEEWAALRNFADELAQRLSSEVKINSVGGGGGLAYEVVIAAISGGTAAAVVNGLYQVIHAYLSKYQARELTFEQGDKKITLKGRSPKEEMELLRALFPENLARLENGTRVIRACFYDPNTTSRTFEENESKSGE